LAYLTGRSRQRYEPSWVDRSGTARPIEPGWVIGAGIFSFLALSPGDDRLAFAAYRTDSNPTQASWDVWVRDLSTSQQVRLTFAGNYNTAASWYDQDSLTFVRRSRRPEIYRLAATGAARGELLVDSDMLAEAHSPIIRDAFLTPDREWLIYRSGGESDGDIRGRRMTDGVDVPLLTTPYGEFGPALSPDGRWLAYTSDETDRNEIYVRPFPDVGSERHVVSDAGGRDPVWAKSGRELFYVNADDEMVAAQVATDEGFVLGEQSALFSITDFEVSYLGAPYDVTADGQEFVMLRRLVAGRNELILVQNFFEELERLPQR
jgi:Tol biopolymer transport system component